MGENFGKAGATASVSIPDFIIGKNESLETRIKKSEMRKKAAEVNYAAMKEEEEKTLDQIEKAKRDINFHLNRIAPENLKEITKELHFFAKDSLSLCEVLISLIIEKSW